MLHVLRKSIFLLFTLLIALPCFAQVTSSQVWNNAQLYNGSTSPVVPVSAANGTYTVYFKPTTLAAQDYSVALQTSPDGVNWSTVNDKSITVSKYSPTGVTYQMTISAKTVNARLFVYPTNLSYSLIASGWIVN